MLIEFTASIIIIIIIIIIASPPSSYPFSDAGRLHRQPLLPHPRVHPLPLHTPPQQGDAADADADLDADLCLIHCDCHYQVSLADGGNYSCQPASLPRASTTLHVLKVIIIIIVFLYL